MRAILPSGEAVVVEKSAWQSDAEARRFRDRIILELTRQGRPSRHIAEILNIHPVSVRRIRSRLGRKIREHEVHHAEAS